MSFFVLAPSHMRWWRSVFCSSVAFQTAWVISRHPLGSSGSWHALHKLIVLSIGNLCRSFRGSPSDACLFSDLLVPLRQTLVSFCENGSADTLQNSRKKGNPLSWDHHVRILHGVFSVFCKVSEHAVSHFSYVRVQHGVST